MTLTRLGRNTAAKPVVAVIDGQGGGFGAALIKELKARFGEALELWALGANAAATSTMMKAKANRGATGENALIHSLPRVDAIMGPIAITWAGGLMGEISPAMAAAVTGALAPKILIPLSQEGVILAGFKSEPLPHLVGEAVNQLAIAAGADIQQA